MATPAYLLEPLIIELEPLYAAQLARDAQAALLPHAKPDQRKRALSDWQRLSRPDVVIEAPPKPRDYDGAKAFFAAMGIAVERPPQPDESHAP